MGNCNRAKGINIMKNQLLSESQLDDLRKQMEFDD